jgi:hypothetical protein
LATKPKRRAKRDKQSNQAAQAGSMPARGTRCNGDLPIELSKRQTAS